MAISGRSAATSVTKSNSPFSLARVDDAPPPPPGGGPCSVADAPGREALVDDLAELGVLRRVHVEHHQPHLLERLARSACRCWSPPRLRRERGVVAVHGDEVVVAGHAPEVAAVGLGVRVHRRLAPERREHLVRHARRRSCRGRRRRRRPSCTWLPPELEHVLVRTVTLLAMIDRAPPAHRARRPRPRRHDEPARGEERAQLRDARPHVRRLGRARRGRRPPLRRSSPAPAARSAPGMDLKAFAGGPRRRPSGPSGSRRTTTCTGRRCCATSGRPSRSSPPSRASPWRAAPRSSRAPTSGWRGRAPSSASPRWPGACSRSAARPCGCAARSPTRIAAELLLTGRRVPAAEAKEIGLIGHVVPDGTAVDKAMEIAEVIAENAPLSVQGRAARRCARAPR